MATDPGFYLEIRDIGNDAFREEPIREVRRILSEVIDQLGASTGTRSRSGNCRDLNGHSVGGWTWEPE